MLFLGFSADFEVKVCQDIVSRGRWWDMQSAEPLTQGCKLPLGESLPWLDSSLMMQTATTTITSPRCAPNKQNTCWQREGLWSMEYSLPWLDSSLMMQTKITTTITPPSNTVQTAKTKIAMLIILVQHKNRNPQDKSFVTLTRSLLIVSSDIHNPNVKEWMQSQWTNN